MGRGITIRSAVTVALFVIVLVAVPKIARADGANPIPLENQQVAWTVPKYDQAAVSASGGVNFGLRFTGGFDTNMVGSSLRVWSGSQSKICDASLSCMDADFSKLEAQGILAMCDEVKAAPCIDAVKFQIGSGEFQPATKLFTVDPSPTAADISALKNDPTVQHIQTQSGWSAQAIPGIPASASGATVIRFPGATNSGGTDTYALESAFIYSKQGSGDPKIEDFHMNLVPVVDAPSSSCTLKWYDFKTKDGSFTNGAGCDSALSAAYFSSRSVGYSAQFPKDITVRVSLKLNYQLGGWFQGRVENPSVSLTPQSDGSNLVTFSGSPTQVPVTAAAIKISDPANALVVDYFGLKGPFWSQMQPGSVVETGDSWTPARGGSRLIGSVANLVGSKAKGYVSAWYFKRLPASGPCTSDSTSLQGLLTTNAMTYDAGLPQMQDGLLKYSVAGVHYDADGKVFQGAYNFIMRDSVAKCLYGFKGAGPISGSVSVTSSDGSENVAYTNVTDDGRWLKLTAEGFTFSNPTIAVKLSQAGSTSSGAGLAAGKIITCTKGKLTKKLSAAPKCPAGWKKK